MPDSPSSDDSTSGHPEPDNKTVHVPVLPDEVIELLSLAPGDTVVDGTLGGGGHSLLISEQLGTHGHLIATDRDQAALERAEEPLSGRPVSLVNSNFCEIPEVLSQLQIHSVQGILLDLGLSSDQLEDRSRGFSFKNEGDLDLRFNTLEGEPAWKLLNRLSEKHLADLLYTFGEERLSRRIARKVVEARRTGEIRTAIEFAEIVWYCYPPAQRHRIHPATRSFQALRIAVNDELESLDIALRRLPDVLAPEGRIAIISFHSLEDRRVKQAFKTDPRLIPVTKKAIQASDSEIAANPRARSARLRVAQKAP